MKTYSFIKAHGIRLCVTASLSLNLLACTPSSTPSQLNSPEISQSSVQKTGTIEGQLVLPQEALTQLAAVPISSTFKVAEWLSGQPAFADEISDAVALTDLQIKTFTVTVNGQPVHFEVLNTRKDAATGNIIVDYRLTGAPTGTSLIVEFTDKSGVVQLSAMTMQVTANQVTRLLIDTHSTAMVEVFRNTTLTVGGSPPSTATVTLNFNLLINQPEVLDLEIAIRNAFKTHKHQPIKVRELPEVASARAKAVVAFKYRVEEKNKGIVIIKTTPLPSPIPTPAPSPAVSIDIQTGQPSNRPVGSPDPRTHGKPTDRPVGRPDDR